MKRIIFGITVIFCLVFAETLMAAVDISSVTVSAIKTNSAVINWDSTVAGTSQIEYGLTAAYGNIVSDDLLRYWHLAKLTGLSEGAMYHYRIKTKDYYGAETISADFTFTALTQTQLDNKIKAARADGGLPKTYYVSTTGNNSNDGLSIVTAWATPSYAVSKVDAGDTIYLLDGTWSKEYLIFKKSGIDAAPITLTAYGNNAILDGVDNTGVCITFAWLYQLGYDLLAQVHDIVINGLKISRYGGAMGNANFVGWNNVVISNNDIGYCGDMVAGATFVNIGRGSHRITVQNNTIHDVSVNSNVCQIRGTEVELGNDPDNLPSDHICFKNNTFTNNQAHTGGVDVVGMMDYIEMTENLYSNITGAFYAHGTPEPGMIRRLNFSYNTITNSGDLKVILLRESLVAYNNITTSNPGDNAISVYSYSGSQVADIETTFMENTVTVVPQYGSYSAFRLGASTLDGIGRGNLYVINNHHQDTATYGFESNNTLGTLRFSKMVNPFTLAVFNTGKSVCEFTNGIVFTAVDSWKYHESGIFTPPAWTPTGSSFGLESISDGRWGYLVTPYPFTARPVAGSATVTVNKFDTTLAKGNVLVDFTADTSNGNNIDFVIGELKADSNYEVKRAGTSYHIVKSNTNKCIKFSNSEWSAKTFTITETDTVADIITPPDITLEITPPVPTDSTPPTIAVTSPADGVTISAANITIGGTASDDTALSQVEVKVGNGSWQVATGTANWNKGITLISGSNTISARATDSSGNIKETSITVTYSVEEQKLLGQKVKVYPNPYIKGKASAKKITFADLPQEATINIFNTGGELVQELSGVDGKAEWDISNVSSGIYLYVIISPEGTKKGKISIIK